MTRKHSSLLSLVVLLLAGCDWSSPPQIRAPGTGQIHVSAVIVDSGHFDQGSGPQAAWIIDAEVRNLSPDPVGIYIMTCSWSDSWVFDTAEDLAIPRWGCDSNYPHQVVFKPDGGWSFRMMVCAKTAPEKITGKKFRIGFRCAASDRESRPNTPIVFSDWIMIPRIEDRVLAMPDPYKEPKEMPNQRPERNAGAMPVSTYMPSAGVAHP